MVNYILLISNNNIVHYYLSIVVYKEIIMDLKELDIDKKIQLFYKINSMLPEQYQPNVPSLITDDYIDTTLYRVHQNMKMDMVNR